MPETLNEFIEKKVVQFLDLHCIDGIIPTTVPGKNLYTEDVKAFLRSALRECASESYKRGWLDRQNNPDTFQNSRRAWLGTNDQPDPTQDGNHTL